MVLVIVALTAMLKVMTRMSCEQQHCGDINVVAAGAEATADQPVLCSSLSLCILLSSPSSPVPLPLPPPRVRFKLVQSCEQQKLMN